MSFLGDLSSFGSDIYNGVVSPIYSGINAASGGLAGNILGGGLNVFGIQPATVVGGVVDALPSVVNTVANAAVAVPTDAINTVSNVASDATSLGSSAIHGISNVGSSLFGSIQSIFSSFGSAIWIILAVIGFVVARSYIEEK